MLRKISMFLIILFIASTIIIGIAAAENPENTDQNEINDSKFDIKLTKMNNNEYKVTVSRKDNTFIDHKTLVYVRLRYIDIDGHDQESIQKIIIDPYQQSNSKIYSFDTIQDSDVTLDPEFGTRFPANNKNLSFNDAVFNLELQYWDPWWGNPYIKYWFYRRDGKPVNSHITVKRMICLQFEKGGKYTYITDDWVKLGLNPGQTRSEGTIHYDNQETLTSFITFTNDYYFQFD